MYESDSGPLWNNLSRVLFVLILALGGLAAYLYWGYGEQLREQTSELDEKNRAVALENERLKEHVGYLTGRLEEEVAKVSVVGLGMARETGVADKMFRALAEAGINILAITTSEIKTSVVLDEKYMELAVRALHKAFDLDMPSAA